MAEDLEPADVAAYTEGRLSASDAGTQRALDAALARVRRWCGWHVTPVRPQAFTMHGSAHGYLVVPTLKLASVVSVTADGETVDLSDVEEYTGEPGVLYRKNGHWCADRVEIEVTHGFTAAEAADFREAVLQLIDSTTLSIGTGANGPLTGKTVDDVEYRWSGITDRSWGIAKNPMNESVLYQFRLLPFA